MKIIQLLGRGIEGCGVTRFTIEFEKYLKKNNYDFVTIALDDKKWSRRSAHNFLNLKAFRVSKEKEAKEFHQELHGDVLIVESFPPKKSSDEVVKNFEQAIKNFKGKIVTIQHDHAALSLRRNLCMKETVLASAKVFAHATKDSDFCKIAKEEYQSNSFLFDDSPKIKILNFQPGFYFDECRQKYWKDISEQDAFHHKWIGRCTSWKGINLFFDFSKYLQKIDALITLEGIEKSPAYIGVKQSCDFFEEFVDADTVDISNRKGQKPSLFGPYINISLLERLSKCGFGYQLSRLDSKFIEHSIEYTHCEIIATGVIPVFRKSYFLNCIHTKTGNPIAKDKNTGSIFLGETEKEFADTILIIDKLQKNNSLRNEWREQAFEYYKAHQDADDVFSKILNELR